MEDKIMDFIEMLWAEHKKLREELDRDPRWQRLEKITELIATYEDKRSGKPVGWPHSKWGKELRQVKEYLTESGDKWVKIEAIAEWLDLNGDSNWSATPKNMATLSNMLSNSKMFEAFRGHGWRNKE